MSSRFCFRLQIYAFERAEDSVEGSFARQKTRDSSAQLPQAPMRMRRQRTFAFGDRGAFPDTRREWAIKPRPLAPAPRADPQLLAF